MVAGSHYEAAAQSIPLRTRIYKGNNLTHGNLV